MQLQVPLWQEKERGMLDDAFMRFDQRKSAATTHVCEESGAVAGVPTPQDDVVVDEKKHGVCVTSLQKKDVQITSDSDDAESPLCVCGAAINNPYPLLTKTPKCCKCQRPLHLVDKCPQWLVFRSSKKLYCPKCATNTAKNAKGLTRKQMDRGLTREERYGKSSAAEAL